MELKVQFWGVGVCVGGGGEWGRVRGRGAGDEGFEGWRALKRIGTRKGGKEG